VTRRRTTAVLLLVTVGLLGTTVAAFAAWTGNGTGSGSGKAKTLGLPISVAAAATGSTSIRVTWLAPTGTSAPPSSYVVRRTAPSTATVCASVAPPATLQCDDTGLTASTSYSYTVEARLGSFWSSGQTTPQSATTNAAVTPFTATALTLANGGTGTAGRMDTSDAITVRFSQALDTGTVCSGWDGTGSKSIVVTVKDEAATPTTTNDQLQFAAAAGVCTGGFRIGVLDLGDPSWLGSTQVFSATLTWVAATKDLVITLGTKTTGTANINGANADFSAVFTPDGALKSSTGTTVDTTQRPSDNSVKGPPKKQLF
jgi:hypothetical protein